MKAQQKSLADCILATVHISSIIFSTSNFIIITAPPTESWLQNRKQLIHYMVTWNRHWTKSSIININAYQHPKIIGITFIQYVPCNKDTHTCFQFSTVVTVHIVIFWVVTVCSPVGGKHLSVKHVASISGAKAGGLRMPLHYIGQMQNRILWISLTTLPATCLQNVNTSSLYSHTQQEWQLAPL